MREPPRQPSEVAQQHGNTQILDMVLVSCVILATEPLGQRICPHRGSAGGSSYPEDC